MDEFNAIRFAPADQPLTRELALAGAMTIHYGNEIKVALSEALDAAESLILDLEKVTEIDLIGLQFICSLHRTAITRGKSVTVTGTGGSVIGAVKDAAGFSRHVGCAKDADNSCIWAEGRATEPGSVVAKQVAP